MSSRVVGDGINAPNLRGVESGEWTSCSRDDVDDKTTGGEVGKEAIGAADVDWRVVVGEVGIGVAKAMEWKQGVRGSETGDGLLGNSNGAGMLLEDMGEVGWDAA